MGSVLILGAGASVHAHGPLMYEFLDRSEMILNGLRDSLQPEDRRALEQVFQAAAELQLAQAKSRLDLDNVESLFSALVMADLLGVELGGARDHGTAMRRLIFRTLQYSMPFEIVEPGSERMLKPSKRYDELATLLIEEGLRPTIITFNYDIALDYALFYNALSVDYGFGTCSERDPVKLLKLHGSLNWAETETGVKAIDLHAYAGSIDLPQPTDYYPLDLTAGLREKGADHGLPFIVPPTWNKWSHQSRIKSVWGEAAKALKSAERIAIAGYSLPETDQFFRYLFSLGIMGETRIKRILVVNPSSHVRERFHELLGQGTRGRFLSSQYEWERTREVFDLLREQGPEADPPVASVTTR